MRENLASQIPQWSVLLSDTHLAFCAARLASDQKRFKCNGTKSKETYLASAHEPATWAQPEAEEIIWWPDDWAKGSLHDNKIEPTRWLQERMICVHCAVSYGSVPQLSEQRVFKTFWTINIEERKDVATDTQADTYYPTFSCLYSWKYRETSRYTCYRGTLPHLVLGCAAFLLEQNQRKSPEHLRFSIPFILPPCQNAIFLI